VARSELTDVPGRDLPEDGELGDVAGMLAADDEQDETTGIRVTLALEHHGEAAISLLNPFEMVQWQLLDERGAPLALPQRAPNLLVIGEQAGSWIEDGPLRVVEAHRDDARIAPEALDTRTVTLEPGEHLAATFELHRLADGTLPPTGSYGITCVATLIDADHPDRSRILRADPVRVRTGSRA
jgi:hypothetical protein